MYDPPGVPRSLRKTNQLPCSGLARYIASLEGLAEALAAPGAVACFARGSPHFPSTEDGRAPDWFLIRSDHPRGLTPTHGLPWVPVPAPTAAGRSAAGAQFTAVPLPLRALVVESLSAPGRLPHLLAHLGAASASHDGNDATVSVPAPAGAPSTSPSSWRTCWGAAFASDGAATASCSSAS